MLSFDDAFDLVIVHRDAENGDPQARCDEIRAGVMAVREGLAFLPVIPVRMTEAWLLLDETAIRRVAGRPTGREPLELPSPQDAEAVPDPKAVLKRALERAAGVSGRRLRQFQRDFGSQRRRLLEDLDHDGPIQSLAAWQELQASVEAVVKRL